MRIFLRELIFGLLLAPFAFVLSLTVSRFYGLEPRQIEENMILLPVLVCFFVFRSESENELFAAAPMPSANIRMARFWAVFLGFCLPLSATFLLLSGISALRFSVFVLSLCFSVSALTLAVRSIIPGNVSAPLVCGALLYLLKNNFSPVGSLRIFQVFGTMDILSGRLFYTGKGVMAGVSLLLLAAAWTVLYFRERKQSF